MIVLIEKEEEKRLGWQNTPGWQKTTAGRIPTCWQNADG